MYWATTQSAAAQKASAQLDMIDFEMHCSKQQPQLPGLHAARSHLLFQEVRAGQLTSSSQTGPAGETQHWMSRS